MATKRRTNIPKDKDLNAYQLRAARNGIELEAAPALPPRIPSQRDEALRRARGEQ